MTITNDTVKSLGFLKKSLKMSRRATDKNQKADGTTGALITDIHGKMDTLLGTIETWEKAAAVSNAIPVVPAGMVQPSPAAAVISTVPDPVDPVDPVDPNDPNDDLLTV